MKTDVQAALDTIAARLVQQFQPLKIILFGSQATGRATLESDIDLLVVMPQVASKRQAAVAMRRCLADLPMGKDIIVATPEEIARRGYIVGTVLHQAITEGKVLYEQA
ncbi:nucleotidyltransferase domain-containing protein [Nodosilinea nodulosa]|uniref:nucleotidyltransferase domain-containing protein n=1 Tax=Nodosilinea nodulosa TaxID=416001 RepID=UPI0002EF30E8|nr:nucleotidyltransferase domain-containing protein [Nodosilinea nodulosa]